jgi:predicted ATP-grasp superfamily ATP-dependent carboligase
VYLVQSGPNSPASKSRFCTETLTWSPKTNSGEQVLELLMDLGARIGRRALLFPTRDEHAILASEQYDILSRWFIYPQQTTALAASLASKKEMYFLAKRHHVPTPEANFPASIADVLAFSRTASFPVMVKGIDGARLKRKVGAGVLIAQSPADLMDICTKAGECELINVMLQEYIPGGDDTVWMFNGYFNSNSDCLFGITGKKIRQYPAYTGATSLGICLANDCIQQTTRRWMKELGYKGILDIGYRYDARDGRYKVLDVNPRIGATFRLFVDQNGMDAARAMYLDLTGQSVSAAPVHE